MTSVRDTQQFDIYDAQLVVDPGRHFSTVDEVQAYVSHVIEQDWWMQLHAHCRGVEVLEATFHRSKGKTAKASARTLHNGVGQIFIPKHGVDEQSVVHELAHIGATARFNTEGHEPGFAREYLELTYRLRGQEEWEKLRASFIKHNIVWEA